MLVLSLPARFPLRFLIAFALGALHASSFIDDTTWPLQIAALAGLVALAIRGAREAADVRRAAVVGARAGFAFGLGWFGVGVSWIYISLHTYGELAAPLAALAVFAFCAYLAIWPAIACAAFAAFRRGRGAPARRGASTAFFAGAWTLAELGRGYVFTGFPWLGCGYAHVGGPLAGYAPLVGVYGVAFLAATMAAALALAANRATRARGPALTFVLVAVLGVPLAGSMLARVDWTAPLNAPVTVRLLQGNVAQDVKFIGTFFAPTANAYLDAIAEKRADLVVLPETAFPVFVDELPPEVAERLAKLARSMSMDIAFGIAIEEPGGRYFNSVLAIGPKSAPVVEPEDPEADAHPGDAPAQRYDKSHIVPFGEFVPTGFHWFVRLLNIPLGDFTRGSLDQRPMRLAGLAVAFNICYEDLFGEEIIRQAVDANVLVNVSNVAWFGDSMALPQHLDIGRMRAIETGLPMLRATNTGMTASIDPHGRVLAALAPFTQGSLDVAVQGMTGTTPFTRLGNAPAFVVAAAALVAACRARSRGARAGRRKPEKIVIVTR